MRSTPHQCRTRLSAAVFAAVLSVACHDGGGLNRAARSDGAGTASVTLGWAEASGPVAGYAVFVQRNSGEFRREQNVRQSFTTLTGAPGDTVVVSVAAYDEDGELGPGSGASAPFTFPGLPDPTAFQPATSASSEQTASATAQSLSASAGAAAPAAGDSPAAAPTSAEAGDAAGEPDAADAASEGLVAADLAGALLWRADDALRVTDAELRTALLAAAPPAAELLGADDFDGDGAADLLWSDGEGLAYTPLAHGAPTLDFARLEPGESVAASGDFDGDGAADLVLSDATGVLGVWLTGAGAPAETLGLQGDARLAAVADFDGDGTDDLLWREADGALSLWLMDAVRSHASMEIVADRALEVVAAGDFDGDGAAELALRDGAGALFLHEPIEGRTLAAGFADPAQWRAVGAGDVDGDGRDELVLTGAGALRGVALPEGDAWDRSVDPASPWELVALLP